MIVTISMLIIGLCIMALTIAITLWRPAVKDFPPKRLRYHCFFSDPHSAINY